MQDEDVQAEEIPKAKLNTFPAAVQATPAPQDDESKDEDIDHGTG